MLEGIPVALLNGIGVVGIVVIVGWMVFTGKLIPRRFYDDVIHDRNEALASGRIKDTQIAEKDDQLKALLEVGKTVDAIMRALPKAAALEDQ